MREPLVQTQVISYLCELIKGGHKIALLTFEPAGGKWDKQTETAIREELKEQGIEWHWLRYHKRFSIVATAWDILSGAVFINRFIRRKSPDVLHGRVHVSTLMAVVARRFSRGKPKILFDIRGFFPEEYTDAGIWPANGFIYRAAKRVEKWLLKEADGFVVLTERAREILFPESREEGFDKNGRPVEVIPCCVDLARFQSVNGSTRAEMRTKLGVSNRKVFVYVGSFGGWYLTDDMINFFSTAIKKNPATFVLILTQRNKEMVEARLKDRGFGNSDFLVESVPPSNIPEYLAAADAAISFIKACYSKQSSSPTKIAEYLASGLPIIANKGVGDIDLLIEMNSVGALINGFSEGDFLDALKAISGGPDIQDHCRQVALQNFDLGQVGGHRYRAIYDRLIKDA